MGKLQRVALSLTTGVFVALMGVQPAMACRWDIDTLAQERLDFPEPLQLMTGKFLRHSLQFYQWRVQDRLKRLAKDPSQLAAYDDLASAYDKLGQHKLAIATMLKKQSLKAGVYETEANLGTFYIHAGQLRKGLEHINKALKINPNAHFGREFVQKMGR